MSHAGLEADEAELPLFEGATGLLAVYLAAEAVLRPIWGRYFTTAFPPDRWLILCVSLEKYLMLNYTCLLLQADGVVPGGGPPVPLQLPGAPLQLPEDLQLWELGPRTGGTILRIGVPSGCAVCT